MYRKLKGGRIIWTVLYDTFPAAMETICFLQMENQWETQVIFTKIQHGELVTYFGY